MEGLQHKEFVWSAAQATDGLNSILFTCKLAPIGHSVFRATLAHPKQLLVTAKQQENLVVDNLPAIPTLQQAARRKQNVISLCYVQSNQAALLHWKPIISDNQTRITESTEQSSLTDPPMSWLLPNLAARFQSKDTDPPVAPKDQVKFERIEACKFAPVLGELRMTGTLLS